MAEFTRYEPGTPSWVDLASPDVAASVAFYRRLFGWEGADQGAEAGHYTIFTLRGKQVGAVTPLQQEGQPPAWTTYVTVDDADVTTKAAREAGGNVLAEPMDVMDLGRMAVFADPTGAVIAIWQARAFPGAQLANEPGSFCWNELNTRDTKAAAAFYGGVFGWKANALDMPGMAYTELKADDRTVAGMMAMPAQVPAEMPAHWLVYFAVDDCDAAVATATGAGATAFVPPTDIPPGRFSVLADPQGAVFAVIKMNPQQ